MKALFIGILLIVVLSSCEDERITKFDNENELLNSRCFPGQDIRSTWLGEKIDEIESSEIGQYFYISEAQFLGQTVFVMNNCCPFCVSIVQVFDCDGNEIGSLGSGENQISSTLLTNWGIIYQTADFACEK